MVEYTGSLVRGFPAGTPRADAEERSRRSFSKGFAERGEEPDWQTYTLKDDGGEWWATCSRKSKQGEAV